MKSKNIFSIFFGLAFFSLTAIESGWHNINPDRPAPPRGTEYFREDFESGSLDNYRVEFRDGAKGEVKIVDTRSRNGKKALKISKHNAEGAIVITRKTPVPVPCNSELQSFIHSSCSNANPDFAIGFIRIYPGKEDLSYNRTLDGRGPGGPKMQFISNSAPGEWERKLAHCKSRKVKNSAVTPAIVVAGTPSESFWDDWGIENFSEVKNEWKKIIRRKTPAPRTGDMISLELFEAGLKNDIDHTAKVVTVKGIPRLIIDGKEHPGVLYKGPVNGKNVKNLFAGRPMQSAGIDLHAVTIQFGNMAKKPGFWHPRGFDIKGAADLVRQAMRSAEKSNFIVSFNISAYPEFTTEHPEEAWQLADGTKVYGHHAHIPYNVRAPRDPSRHWDYVSCYSLVWQNAVKKVLSELIAELKRSGLSKRIVGVHIAGFHDSQFATRQVDYSRPAVRAFREYLREKYGSDAALQKAWKQKDVKLATVNPPLFGTAECFDPEKDQDKYDFHTFQKQGPFRMQESIARHVRQEFGKEIVLVRYCMGVFGGAFNGAYDITPFITSKEYDIICSQPSYSRRTPGYSVALLLPAASFRAHNKMTFSEFDFRTFGAITGGETELRVLGLSQAQDVQMWESINRKLAGILFARSSGFWYLDFPGAYYSPAGIAADIADMMRSRKLMAQTEAAEFKPDALFIIDESGMLYRNIPGNYYNKDINHTIQEQLTSLASSGVPHDVVLMSDIISRPADAAKYKVIIFGGMYYVDNPRMRFIQTLKNSRRTLVFLSGTGRLGGAEKATGFQWQMIPAGQIGHEVVPAPGVDVNMRTSMYNEMLIRYMGKKSRGKYALPTRFSLKRSGGMKVLGVYREDNAVATAEKDFGSYRSVAVGCAGGLTPEYFNVLTKQAGGFTVSEPGLQSDINGNFLSLHCLIPGKYRISLPRKCTVINLKSGQKIAADSFTLDAVAGSSYWYLLQ